VKKSLLFAPICNLKKLQTIDKRKVIATRRLHIKAMQQAEKNCKINITLAKLKP